MALLADSARSPRRRLRRALAALTLVAVGLGLGAAPAGAADSPQEIVLRETNDYRARLGLAPLHLGPGLSSVAQQWSSRMLAERRLYHNANYANEIPSGWTRAAENVGYACGFGGPNATTRVIMRGWLNSPGHEANIRGAYSDIGIGIAYDPGSDCAYATQNFGAYAYTPTSFSLVGTVSPPAGKSISSLAGSRVWASNGSVTRSAPVSSLTGGYVLRDLPRGTYRVRVVSGTSNITSEYLRDAASSRCAKRLTVTRDIVGLDVALGTGSLSGPSSSLELCDVTANRASSHYSPFADEIGWLADAGITTGYANGTGAYQYRPLTTVNRDAMAAFLYRLAGEPTVSTSALADFADVSATQGSADYSIFAKEIAWLAEEGISTGWTSDGDTEFRPLGRVTRDAMAAFLYRFAGEPGFTPPSVSPFADVRTDHPFYTEIAWLASTGVTTGWSVGSRREYRPGEPITRDAMAAFLYRFDRSV